MIGAGGLGVPVLQYLAAAGVGRIGIVDGDVVEASNLHRQPLYGVADIGRPKAVAAADRLRSLNRDVRCEAHRRRTPRRRTSTRWSRDYDLVVECTDNFRAKFLVNDAVVRAGKPAVFASVYQYEGQLQAYLPRPDWPCLRCLWPEAPRDGMVGNCAEAGVLGPVPATLGAMQAMQALQRHARPRAGAGTRARGRGPADLLDAQHPRVARAPAAITMHSRAPRRDFDGACSKFDLRASPRRAPRLRAGGHPRGVGAAIRSARPAHRDCTCR